MVAAAVYRYNSAGDLPEPRTVFEEKRSMDHELREKCQDLIQRIKHLQDSL